MKNCYRCPYNGKGSKQCIQCCSDSTNKEEDFSKHQYIFDFVDPIDNHEQETEERLSVKVTDLPEDEEDHLRKLLYTIFDLSPLELLCLQAIMKGRTLTEAARELSELFKRQKELMGKNAEKNFTRHHFFQLRKAILNKAPDLKFALETQGQRKQLNGGRD